MNSFRLSAEEMALVQNAGWILTKRRIIEKVYVLFGELSATYTPLLQQTSLPAEISSVSPKIYKGEAYQQLPYVLLDQPRFFKGNDALAIRSFFWWGKSFSIHLHLSGIYTSLFRERLLQWLDSGNNDQWYAAVTNDPWQHHFEPDNYLPIQSQHCTRIREAWQTTDFIKIGQPYPIAHWDTVPGFYHQQFTALLQLLS